MRQVVLNKRGLAQKTVAGFALALAAAVVMLAFIGKFSFVTEDLLANEQCLASVEQNSRYHIAGIDLGSEVDCPTIKKVLEKESGEEAKEEVADAMYRCWKRFGRGQLNLFSGEGVFCNVCYIIDVNTKQPITGFGQYLMETRAPGENMYYYDYLRGFKSEMTEDPALVQDFQGFFNNNLEVVKDVELESLKTAEIENNETYSVIFVYAKGLNNIEKIIGQITLKSSAGKAITPIAVGSAVLAGATVVGIALTAPVSVPVLVVAGAAVATSAAVFAATEFVGSLFNPGSPPDWAGFTVLRVWNPEETPQILRDELGCQELVGTKSN